MFENSLKREISNETAAISRWNPIFKHVLVQRFLMEIEPFYKEAIGRIAIVPYDIACIVRDDGNRPENQGIVYFFLTVRTYGAPPQVLNLLTFPKP
ncbi:MAG: hypothetical protein LBS62_09445 [Clostridiales bacterium]|nr:hypothetical protein [Clostridiales bacterium]